VGALTALIYFSAMWIAQSVFSLNYIFAVSIAYFFSTIFHFFANRLYTFRSTKDDYLTQFGRYIILWFLNYIATILVVWISVDILLLSPYLGVCISVIFTSFTGYMLGHFWVFKLKR
jgi:putative flippase GtrA